MLYLATQPVGDVLGAVADAQHRHFAQETVPVNLGRIGVQHGTGAAGQNDSRTSGVSSTVLEKGMISQ